MSLIRYSLKKRDVKNLLEELSKIFGNEVMRIFGSRPKIESAKVSHGEILIINNSPALLRVEGIIIPTLAFYPLIEILPKVVVDMGAVPHICNGADVMAPGIVRIEGEFREGEPVIVLDEKHGKAIAVTRALIRSDIIGTLKHGRVLKNLHYVGDAFWEAMKAFRNERVKI